MGRVRERLRVLLGAVAIVLCALLTFSEARAESPGKAARTVRELTAQAAAFAEEDRPKDGLSLARQAYDLGRAELGEAAAETLAAGEQLARATPEGAEQQSLLGDLVTTATAKLGADAPLTLRLRRAFALSLDGALRPGGDEYARRLADITAALQLLVADTARVYGPSHPEALRARVDLGDHYESGRFPSMSPCESRELARDQFIAALNLRRDADFLPSSRRKRPLEDLKLVLLSGHVADIHEKLEECAEALGRDADMRRYGELKAAYRRKTYDDARKFFDPADDMMLVIAGAEAEEQAKAGRQDEARRIVASIADELRRRGRGDHPAAIQLELTYLDCPPRQPCSPESHARLGQLAKAAAAFGERRRPTPYEMYAYTFLGETFRYIDQGAWLAAADAVFARSVALRTKLHGVAGARTAAQFHLDFRRDTPQFASRAVEPARVVVAANRARAAARGGSLQASGDVERSRDTSTVSFMALADAAWLAGGSTPTGAAPLADEVYQALQDSMAGSVSRSLALSAAQRAAEGRGLSELVRRRSDLADGWTRLDAAFVTAASRGTDEQVGRLRRQRDDVAREAAELDGRLKAQFPDYFEFLNPKPVDIKATQALLAPDEAILFATPGLRGGVHIMAVSATQFEWRRSALERSKVEDMVDQLLWLTGADVDASAARKRRWAAEAGEGLPFNRKLAFELYGQLVGPVDPVLAGKRHIYLVTGRSLSRLPFGILVTAPPSGDDRDPAALRATPWFADAHALAVIPSVRSLQLLRKSPAAAAPRGVTFAGFGDPALNGQAEQRGGRARAGPRIASVFVRGAGDAPSGQANVAVLRGLARLPGTAVELENMRRLLQAPESAVRLGPSATETAVKDADLSEVRVLAFATHGLLAGELPGGSEPGLVFTPPAEATDKDDGLLAASEVAGLRLAADWVILSACNTAAGTSSGATGLSGLARAFFHAGARSLLVSYWPVRDDVASEITVDAIRLQRADPLRSRAEALQLAMRRIRDDPKMDRDGDTWAHPNAWAAFSLVGDGAEAAQRK